jgi:hypothetical protein
MSLVQPTSMVRSFSTICCGECFLRFIESPSALQGRLDSHITWPSSSGSRSEGPA